MRHSASTFLLAGSSARTADGARTTRIRSGDSRRSGSPTIERTLAHTFSSPVVRELLPVRSRAIAGW